MKKAMAGIAALAAAGLVLTGCSNSETDSDKRVDTAQTGAATTPTESAAHQDHGSGSAPTDMPAATNAKYKVGQKVIITADHMGGMMEGVEGTVTGAYDTTTYAVNYVPTDGSAEVYDHKWVVQDEIAGGNQHGVYADGSKVVLDADHMPGMEGAEATIVSSTDQPVYTVTFTDKDGKKVTNHKWVVQDELKPVS